MGGTQKHPEFVRFSIESHGFGDPASHQISYSDLQIQSNDLSSQVNS